MGRESKMALMKINPCKTRMLRRRQEVSRSLTSQLPIKGRSTRRLILINAARRDAVFFPASDSIGVRAMKKSHYAMLALALLGLAVAFYDSYALYNRQALWCPPPINGCNEVANSPYARIFDLPVGYFGVVYYLYMFFLAGLLAFDPFSRGLRFGAVAYAALGVSFSIYFMYLQINFIHALCIYCIISAVTTLLLLIAALSHLGAASVDLTSPAASKTMQT
jgi:uncharacterized membrane protein